jgi:hypothetical protein
MKEMEKLNDGDIILYLDSQCKIVLEEKQYLLDYLEIVKEKKLYFLMIGILETIYFVKVLFNNFVN